MMKKRNHAYFLTVLIASFCIPSLLFAGPDLKLQPKISAEWRSDGNYYLAQERERSVFTYSIHPGFRAELNAAKTSLMLDYTLDAYYYDDQDPVPPGETATDEDNYTGHTLTGEVRYQAFDRLIVGLNDSFYKTRDPAESDAFNNSVDREKYYLNRLSPFVVYEFGPKFTARLRYHRTDIEYDPEDRENAKEHRGIFNLVYHFTRVTSVDLEVQHWQKEYDRTTSDYTSNQAKLILRREFRIFKLGAGAGYQNRNFDDPMLDDSSTFTYNLDFGGAGLIANRRSFLKFNVEQNFNDQSFGDNYYKATRFILKAGHEFTRKLSGDTEVSYQIADYERNTGSTTEGNAETRKDKTTEFSGNIRYNFARWLTFIFTGGIESRDSNLPGLDYDNTFLIARLEFIYDLARE